MLMDIDAKGVIEKMTINIAELSLQQRLCDVGACQHSNKASSCDITATLPNSNIMAMLHQQPIFQL